MLKKEFLSLPKGNYVLTDTLGIYKYLLCIIREGRVEALVYRDGVCGGPCYSICRNDLNKGGKENIPFMGIFSVGIVTTYDYSGKTYTEDLVLVCKENDLEEDKKFNRTTLHILINKPPEEKYILRDLRKNRKIK